MAFSGCGDFPITTNILDSQPQIKRLRQHQRHNDPDEAQKYRNERRARKIKAMLSRKEPVSDESMTWFKEYERLGGSPK